MAAVALVATIATNPPASSVSEVADTPPTASGPWQRSQFATYSSWPRFSERIADGLYLTDKERAICARHRQQSTGVWSLGTTRLGPGTIGADWTPTEDGPLFPFGV